MDRHTLEEQLRQTLAAKAETVRPAPDLWERVADQTTRRSAWRSPALWGGLAAAAAVIAAVAVAPGLFNQPDAPVIDNPPSETSAETPAVTGNAAARFVIARDGVNAIGGFGGLYAADPVTGEVTATIHEGQPERDAPFYESLDIRPGGTGEVAALVTIEGQWDIRVHAANGDLVTAFVADQDYAETDEPRLSWSEDGAYLLWTSTNEIGTGVHVLDYEEYLADASFDAPFGALDMALAFTVEAWDDGTIRLLDVEGVAGGDLEIRATDDGQMSDLRLVPLGDCPAGDCTYMLADVAPITEDGPARVATATAGTASDESVDIRYDLLFDVDELVLSGSVDGQGTGPLELPAEFQSLDAPLFDAWMSAWGNQVVVGRGGAAWLLSVDVDAADPTVLRTVRIPGNVTGASLGGLIPGSGDEAPAAVTELRAEITTIGISPDSHPVDVDIVQLVGGTPAQPDAISRVNGALQDLGDTAIDEWDTDGWPGEVDPPGQFTLRATPTLLTPTLLSVEYSGYEFYGGANGQGYWITTIFDLTSGATIAYDDLFNPELIVELADVVAAALHPQIADWIELPALVDIIVSDPANALANVTVTEQGLRFHLDEGVVPPNAVGALTVDVPAIDVESFILAGPVRDHLYGPSGPDTSTSTVSAAEPLDPSVVVSHDEAAGVTTLSTGNAGIVLIPTPDAVRADEIHWCGAGAVQPGTASGTVAFISVWCAGDGETRVLSVVTDGQLVANDVLPAYAQNAGGGGATQNTSARPVFDPTGRYLAWFEYTASRDAYDLVVQPWEDGQPRDQRFVVTDLGRDDVRPSEVFGFGWTGPAGTGDLVVWGAATSLDPFVEQRQATAYRVSMPVADGQPDLDNATVATEVLEGDVIAAGFADELDTIADLRIIVAVEGGHTLVAPEAQAGVGSQATSVGIRGADLGFGDGIGQTGVGGEIVLRDYSDGRYLAVALDGQARLVDLPTGTVSVR